MTHKDFVVDDLFDFVKSGFHIRCIFDMRIGDACDWSQKISYFFTWVDVGVKETMSFLVDYGNTSQERFFVVTNKLTI